MLRAVVFRGEAWAFRLHEVYPLAAESFELVQEESAQIGLQRLVNVRHRHALLQRLVAIDVGVDLRDGGGELRSDTGKLGPFTTCFEELLQVLGQKFD